MHDTKQRSMGESDGEIFLREEVESKQAVGPVRTCPKAAWTSLLSITDERNGYLLHAWSHLSPPHPRDNMRFCMPSAWYSMAVAWSNLLPSVNFEYAVRPTSTCESHN
jgi:hypothetical protein